jgi:hypothetical protein
MSMGYCRLSLAAVATLSLLIAAKPEPASAGSALALAMMHADAGVAAGAARPRVSVHFRRSQSYYCYPRNYWWFYRPYTTAEDGHARCMPYFHYLEPYGRSGARPDRSMK